MEEESEGPRFPFSMHHVLGVHQSVRFCNTKREMRNSRGLHAHLNLLILMLPVARQLLHTSLRSRVQRPRPLLLTHCLPGRMDRRKRRSWTSSRQRQTRGDSKFVPPEERIATFDQDGTTWVEHPIYSQVLFAFDRVAALAPQHPEWKTKKPFQGHPHRRQRGHGEVHAEGHRGYRFCNPHRHDHGSVSLRS